MGGPRCQVVRNIELTQGQYSDDFFIDYLAEGISIPPKTPTVKNSLSTVSGTSVTVLVGGK